jgi:hypothetical protein
MPELLADGRLIGWLWDFRSGFVVHLVTPVAGIGRARLCD